MTTGLYESFNARNYTPRQVAATFVSSQDYVDLWRNEHTVVLGPRGSGKTTLFKMLTVQALYSWTNRMAAELRNHRPFTAIYVPTDMHWHHQLRRAEEALKGAPRFNQATSQAAVTTSVLIAVARSFQDRIECECPNGLELEARLCQSLHSEWRMPKTLPSLEVLIIGLKSRMSEIRKVVNEAILRDWTDSTIPTLPDYFYLDYFASTDVACHLFDSVFRLKQADKWALCLDELELAPRWLQDLAFSQQRSTEEAFLIKLSTSPIPEVLGATEARPKQDVRLITIWNHSGRRGDEFAEDLCRSVLRRRLGSDVDPEALFGRSDLVLQADAKVDKYERGSTEWQLVKEVAEWDNHLRQLLLRSGIDPTDPYTTDIARRDSLLRKIKPLAVFRRAFLKPGASRQFSLRSRKLGTIYYGREAIYRISDGNPRRLIGILGDMCSKAVKGKSGTYLRIAPNEQAEVLTRASSHFFGYVHALPGGNVVLSGHNFDLATVLRTVAKFFKQRLLGWEFPLDPVGSFIVDASIDDKIVGLLRLAVYHGALVHVDPLPDTIEVSPRGKRFRLSYMLAPQERLPLTLYDPIALSTILRSSQKPKVRRVLPAIVRQDDLFQGSQQ